jgi:hypothetical protein
MKLNGKQLIVIGVILVLVYLNITIASLYMTKSLTITGGVSVVGAIQIYDSDGVTPLTSIAFNNFTGGNGTQFFKYYYVNNTGNQPVYVRWNISSSTITWLNMTTYYAHNESGVPKYLFYNYPPSGYFGTGYPWSPRESNSTAAISLAVGSGVQCFFMLFYSGFPDTPETFSLTVTFYAESS